MRETLNEKYFPIWSAVQLAELGLTHYPQSNESNTRLELTEDELVKTLPLLQMASAPGPSGISARLLKALVGHKPFRMKLTELFNKLLKAPSSITRARHLFCFSLSYIPKPGKQGEYRPIAVQEVFLKLFHRILLGRMREIISLEDNQYLERLSGTTKAAEKA